MIEDTIVLVDTETSSLSPSDGVLIEVAFARYSLAHASLISANSLLVTSSADEVRRTEAVHGIPPELVVDRGVARERVMSFCAQAFGGACAIVAHNADFDSQWFDPAVARLAPWVCSANDLKWPKGGGSRALTSLSLAHGLGVLAAHRALDDVMTLARLFSRAHELGEDLRAMLDWGLRPKALFVADVPFERKDEAKAEGFRWDGEKKRWWRRMAIADVPMLPFRTKRAEELTGPPT